MDTKQHYPENELTLWACTNRQMKKISGLFLWCGGIIGVLRDEHPARVRDERTRMEPRPVTRQYGIG